MKTHIAALRTKFLAGLVVVVPAVATVLAVRFLFHGIDGLLGPWVGRLAGRSIPGLGIVVTAVLVLVIGVAATNLVGRRFISLAENLFTRLPLIRRLYGASKDIVESATMSQAKVFKDVVLVEYPRRGLFTYGFVTGYTTHRIANAEMKMAHVFMPGPPIPTSGVLVAVPVDELVYLDLPIDEALKLILSVGMTVPEVLDELPRPPLDPMEAT